MVFQTVCLLLAVYLSVFFITRFARNKNSTSIDFKKYSAGNEDKYPTFSICFKGPQFHWYHKREIYATFGLGYMEYEKMLKGEKFYRYEYNRSSRLFDKIDTTLDYKDDMDFHIFHLNVSDFLVDTNFTYLNSSHHPNSFYLRKNTSAGGILQGPLLNISYQSPDMICFGRDARNISDSTTSSSRVEDSLKLKK